MDMLELLQAQVIVLVYKIDHITPLIQRTY
jgi:hypothetical protein